MRPDFFKLKLDFISELANSVTNGACFGVEVGVFEGALSKHLFKSVPGLTLTGIDPYLPWQAVEPNSDEKKISDGIYHKQWYESQEKADQLFEKTNRLYQEHNATLIRKTSKEALNLFEDASLDFVYIDGDHSYEAVLFDINGWRKKVRPGGIVCGDDFNWRGNLDNVARAVCECFQYEYGMASDVWFWEKYR